MEVQAEFYNQRLGRLGIRISEKIVTFCIVETSESIRRQ